jgi:hypothetical protein
LHFDCWFYVRDTSYDTGYSDQVTEFGAFDVPDSETGGLFLICGRRDGFEVEVVATGEGWRE